MSDEGPDRLLTERQLAEYLQVSPKTVEKWRHDGEGISFIRVGRNIRYRVEDVNAYLDAHTIGRRT